MTSKTVILNHLKPYRNTLFLCFLICPLLVQSKSPLDSERLNSPIIEISRDSLSTELTPYTEFVSDSTFGLSFEDLMKHADQYHFTGLSHKNEFDLPNGVAYWLRFKVRNRDSISLYRFFTVYQRNIERLQMFIVAENGRVDSFPMIGTVFSFGQQATPTQSPSFDFNFEPQKTYTLYLYLAEHENPIATNFSLDSTAAILSVHNVHWQGFLVGIGFFYVCLSFGMFWFMKTPLYFAYFVYAVGGCGYLAATTGLGYEHIWSYLTTFDGIAENVFASVAIIGFLSMSIYFFDTPQYFPKLDKLLKAVIAVGFVVIIAALFRHTLPDNTYKYIANIGGICIIFALPTVLIICIWVFYLFRHKEVFFFLLAFSSFFITVGLNLLHEIGFTVVRHWAHNVMPNFTLFFELSIFLFILGTRVKNEWVNQKLKEVQLQYNILEQRERISRDLHDDVGSTLNSISLFSEIAQQQIRDIHPEASPILARIGEASRDLVTTINDIVWAVNPKNDQFENITLRMRLFAADLLMPKNVLIDFEADKRLNNVNLTIEQRKHFYLIFKEAINNVYKYADCNKLNIHIELCDTHICMTIADNGHGFDMSNHSKGNGLQTMQERTEILRGVLSIASALNEGTRLFLNFPIEDKNDKLLESVVQDTTKGWKFMF